MRSDPLESYFEFDDANKEIKFKRADMPTPWLNYLTNGTLTTLISQAGGGLTFYKSPQIWRISHYKFFHIPTDRGGFYFYFRDPVTGHVYSPTFEPCRRRPEKWNSYHGMGYTRFEAEFEGIKTQLTYYIGPDENALICDLKIKSEQDRKMQVFAFLELGMMEFLREIQWQCYNKHQLSVDYNKDLDALVYRYGVEMQPREKDTPLVYFAASRKSDGYDGDRDEFVGCYRGEELPYAVEQGACTNSILKGGDPQFALQFDFELKKEVHERMQVFLGTGMDIQQISDSLHTLRNESFCEQQFEKLKEQWDSYLDHFHAEIPDKNAQRMINIWNPYQAHKNFLFSRNISYYATGTFRGVGFRDSAQDVLAMIPFDCAAARAKLKQLLAQQYTDGHTNHYFFPEENWPPLVRTHSDNHLWPVLSVYALVMEEGSTQFLYEKVPFYDGNEGTVWEHLQKSMQFTASHTGKNGFPLMLHSDWNDMLSKVCREGKGESIFVAETFCLACRYMEELCDLIHADKEPYSQARENMIHILNERAWDGKWFRRATMDSGEFLGSDACPQAKIWLNTQSWAVLAGLDTGKCREAMDSVNELLDTPYGIKKIHPAMQDYPSKEDPLTYYNKGCGENGSVFCHANTWAIIAECMLGRGNRAYHYYSQLIPLNAMRTVGVWRYKAEPYVYVSNIFGPEAYKPGLANVSWLTGTAAWMYIAVTQYILGILPQYDGLKIDPCIPSDWSGFRVQRLFRGCKYDIEVCNPNHVQKGVKEIYLDGVLTEKKSILSQKTTATVKVILG